MNDSSESQSPVISPAGFLLSRFPLFGKRVDAEDDAADRTMITGQLHVAVPFWHLDYQDPDESRQVCWTISTQLN